jgi:peptidoglycan/LPS O-acetylase OafA/YrhL
MASTAARDYRPDIDGLRAVAVLPVVFFHAGVGAIPGGYVGVDVFFVISGYLITGILLRELDQGDYSVLRFYARRVRRIFPALFAMLAAVAAAGWFLLLPREYNDLGNAIAAATFFYSNYHFMGEAGYFAAPAETQALLHTWSLAVEEQFYIVFPFLLWGLVRAARGRVAGAIAALAAASLAYSILAVQAQPESAFYSTPARAWELALGSLLAAWPGRGPLPRWAAESLAAAGLAAIVAAVLFFTRSTPFPGAAALLPCLGAAAIIRAGSHNATAAGALLATAPLRYTGLVSYSLYLWHWPILVLARLALMRPLTGVETAGLVVLTFVVATISWRWIEAPFRQRRVLAGQRPLLLAGGGAMLAALVGGVLLSRLDGIPARFPAEVGAVLAAETDRAPLAGCAVTGEGDRALRVCPVAATPGGAPSFAVWGDSHAEALLPAVEAAARKAGRQGVYVGRDGCLPLEGARQVREGYEDCVANAAAVLDYLAGNAGIRTVFLASRWALYASGQPDARGGAEPLFIRDGETRAVSAEENRRVFTRAFARTMRRLAATGVEVVFVEQVPEAPEAVPAGAARNLAFGLGRELRAPRAGHVARCDLVAALIAAATGPQPARVLRPWEPLCGTAWCEVTPGGVPAFRDTSHLTRRYAAALAPVFAPALAPPALHSGTSTAGTD